MTIREHVRSVSILVYAQARRGAYVVCVQINAGVVEDSLNTRVSVFLESTQNWTMMQWNTQVGVSLINVSDVGAYSLRPNRREGRLV